MTVPPATALALAWRSFRSVLPASAQELKRWTDHASRIPDPELRKQALASLAAKRFHADGGTVYATCASGEARQTLVSLIVALQTISDYLDNLCDRSTSLDPQDFRQLHQAMLDGVTPGAPLQDYYLHRAEQDDAGYLAALVACCQEAGRQLPGYAAAQPHVRRLVSFYCDLQVHKHVIPHERVPRLTQWFDEHAPGLPPMDWWEFSAATGSTLGLFALFTAALDPLLDDSGAAAIVNSYFPWVCGLHILLDYLIDQEEDRIGGDLNFVTQYETQARAYQRIEHFAKNAFDAVDDLPHPHFHRLIIHGLIGMYLSDAKVLGNAPHAAFAKHLTEQMGRTSELFHWVSRYYRRKVRS